MCSPLSSRRVRDQNVHPIFVRRNALKCFRSEFNSDSSKFIECPSRSATFRATSCVFNWPTNFSKESVFRPPSVPRSLNAQFDLDIFFRRRCWSTVLHWITAVNLRPPADQPSPLFSSHYFQAFSSRPLQQRFFWIALRSNFSPRSQPTKRKTEISISTDLYWSFLELFILFWYFPFVPSPIGQFDSWQRLATVTES